MSEHESFYTLLNLEKACPRRTIFRLKGIKGINQYYHARKINERNRIYQYLADKFHLDTSKIHFQDIDEQFISRLEKEEIGELIDNLEKIIQLYGIEFTELNRQIIYTFNNVSAKLYLDGIGRFLGKDTLFKFNFTTRFNRNHALELVCCENYLRDPNMFKICLNNYFNILRLSII